MTDKQTLTVTQTVEVSKEFLNDVMTTALEGGINYWASITETKTENVEGDTVYLSATVVDAEDEDAEEHTVTLEKLVEAIQKIVQPEFDLRQDIKKSIISGVLKQDAGYIDAEGADVIFQVAAMGSIVFA